MDAQQELSHLREFADQETKRAEALRTQVEEQINLINSLRAENETLKRQLYAMKEADGRAYKTEASGVGMGE